MGERPRTPWSAQAALNWFLRGMVFLPLGAVVAWAISGDPPNAGEVIFLISLSIVFGLAAWRRRVWPFGPN